MARDAKVHEVALRMGLRPPQAESLEILAAVAGVLPWRREGDLAATLAAVKELCASVEDFERGFPSLTFALATGVGKTRLMGAFIAYLHAAKGVKNFFVLAPGLTVYEKLKRDFTPSDPKYVLAGLGTFAQRPPVVITGENYANQRVVRPVEGKTKQGQLALGDEVHINLFNIGKINAETRVDPKTGKARDPKLRQANELFGEDLSYFDYLKSLPDLVLIMDESHRYRATRGMTVLNELNPLLGLELTATPFVEDAKGKAVFKNIAYSYPLSRAITDGFVKKPVGLTRLNFKAENYTEAELERVKLEDAVRVHESVKVELELYHRETGAARVKPFLLVVAQNVEHAEKLRQLVGSASFFNGAYAGKVLRVDSAQRGEEKEETVERLLQVESPYEPTEIVVHVNMLKEGWDVRNLFVIVPLRAANASLLVEQTVGRGLRLPFGQLTGRDALDRLTIVAHDRFDELIASAALPDSLIRGGIVVGKDLPEEGYEILATAPTFATPAPSAAPAGDAVGGEAAGTTTGGPSATGAAQPALPLPLGTAAAPTKPIVPDAVFLAASRAITTASNKPTTFATVGALVTESGVAELTKSVLAQMGAGQTVTAPVREEVKAQVKMVAEHYVKTVVGIPRIRLLPTGDVNCGYKDFDLDVSGVHYPPVDEAMLLRYLQDQSKSEVVHFDDKDFTESTLDDEIVKRLIDYDDIDYTTTKDLLYKLAGQMAAHLTALHHDEALVKRVGRYHLQQIVRLIHAQMDAHFWEAPTAYDAYVDGGFTDPKTVQYKVVKGEGARHFREGVEDKGSIRQMVFGGFARCVYPHQKFDSDRERLLAVLLEDDGEVLVWMKPARGLFTIRYKSDALYEPDFVIETKARKYLLEVKRADDLEDKTVLAKQAAAVEWCAEATKYELKHGGKEWRYLLVPHDDIHANGTVLALEQYWKKAP